MNRADSGLVRPFRPPPSSSSRLTSLCPQIDYMQYTIDNAPIERGENYALAKQFGQTLVENCREMIGQAPLYKDSESLAVSVRRVPR